MWATRLRCPSEAAYPQSSPPRSCPYRHAMPPWGHPRYPARDGGAERLVLSPKRPLERGFFVRHDEDVEEEPEQRAVDDEAPIAHQHRLTQDDGNDRDVYAILARGSADSDRAAVAVAVLLAPKA